jgi:hypothetical protein
MIFVSMVVALSGFTDFTFLLEPSSVVVSRGDNAVFHCSVQSESGTPSVTWTKDGQSVSVDDRK